MKTSLIVKGVQLNIKYDYFVEDKETGEFYISEIRVYSDRLRNYVAPTSKLDTLLGNALYDDDSVKDDVWQDIIESAEAQKDFQNDCKREEAWMQ